MSVGICYIDLNHTAKKFPKYFQYNLNKYSTTVEYRYNGMYFSGVYFNNISVSSTVHMRVCRWTY